MKHEENLLPSNYNYHALCTKLDFDSSTNPIHVTPDGRIGFTALKPDELLHLLKRIRECGFAPTRSLLQSVRKISPRNINL